MSPPTNGRFVASPSSTGTVPKSNARLNGGRVPSEPSLEPSQNLERLLREHHTRLSALQRQQQQPQLRPLSEDVESRMFRLYSNQFRNPDADEDQMDLTDEEMLDVMQYQLSVLQRQRQSETTKKKLSMDQLKADNSKMKQTLLNQQDQIQQLTQSLNQCFQALLTIQRDVATLQQQSSRQDQDAMSQLDSVSQTQRDFESHVGSWDFEFRQQQPPQVASAPPPVDPWNSFFTNGRAASIVSDSANSNSGALNNTVPPGMRANNYWDNFRSFSRQNRLGSVGTSSGLVMPPMVAQVTPSRQVPQLHLPHSPFRAEDSMMDNAAMVEPYFMGSPSRPRRKQKINREQNVSNSILRCNGRPLEAAMVLPMPQQQQSQQNEVQVQPIMNTVVTSIKRSIYSHVNDLIARNEERPEQLARLFHDLQSINNEVPMASNVTTTSSEDSSRQRQSWYEAPVQDDDEEEDNNVTTSTSFFKNKRLNNDNRLALLAASSNTATDVNSSGGSSMVLTGGPSDDDPLRLFSYEESLASLGAVGGLSMPDDSSKKLNEEKQNVAVPKNIQRNIISRERDGRKIRSRGGEEKPPRNMQEEVQSDMVEADQAQSQNTISEIGLDRVPTRLSSSELEARRQEEDENLQNLVDEVLNTSSETDFVTGSLDLLNSPK